MRGYVELALVLATIVLIMAMATGTCAAPHPHVQPSWESVTGPASVAAEDYAKHKYQPSFERAIGVELTLKTVKAGMFNSVCGLLEIGGRLHRFVLLPMARSNWTVHLEGGPEIDRAWIRYCVSSMARD